MSTSGETSASEWKQFVSVLLVFCANGLQAGAYTVLVADLAGALGLSGSALGVALATLSGASIPGVLVAGRLSDRWGRRPVLMLGSAGTGLFLLLLAVVGGYAALLGAMAFGGLAFSFFDLSYPSLGGDYERRHEKETMTKLYVGFDGAVALGAFGSGLALHLGTSYRAIYATLGALLLLLAAGALLLPFPGRAPARREDADGERHREGRLLTRGVVLAVVFVGLISLLDAALEGYSSIYLRDVLESGALLAGVGIAVAQLASLLGRLGSSAAVRWAGQRGTLVGAGVGTALGIAALVTTPLTAVAAAGLLAVRAFEAPVHPVSYSLAAHSAPGRAGQAASLAWGAFYAAFLVGPLIVGFLADLISLRFALSLFVLTSLLIAGISFVFLRGEAVQEESSA